MGYRVKIDTIGAVITYDDGKEHLIPYPAWLAALEWIRYDADHPDPDWLAARVNDIHAAVREFDDLADTVCDGITDAVIKAANLGRDGIHFTAGALRERTTILDYLRAGQFPALSYEGPDLDSIADAISRGDHLKTTNAPAQGAAADRHRVLLLCLLDELGIRYDEVATIPEDGAIARVRHAVAGIRKGSGGDHLKDKP